MTDEEKIAAVSYKLAGGLDVGQRVRVVESSLTSYGRTGIIISDPPAATGWRSVRLDGENQPRGYRCTSLELI